jgi:hypothetical protein
VATYALTIGGSAVRPSIHSLRITAPANGSSTLQCAYAITTTASIPPQDTEIILTENGTTIFGGFVATTRVLGLGGGPTSSMWLEITANDYNQLADRRYIGVLIGGVAFLAGTTLKSALTVIVAYIPGASLHASQVDGPTFSATFIVYGQMVRQTLDQLTDITGYLWQIDENKKLRMYAPGDLTAPFDVADHDGNTIGDVTVTPSRDDFANRVYVWGGPGVIGVAENAASVAATGDHEYMAQDANITDQGVADATAAALLASKVLTLSEVTYSTRRVGLKPGQTQTIACAARNVNALYTLTQVNTEYYNGSAAIRRVTALLGNRLKATWRQKTTQMFGGSSNAGAVTILPSVQARGLTSSNNPYATPPSNPANGDLWLPSDSVYALRYSSTVAAWQPWGPIQPLTLPNDATFSWTNQGGATVTTSTGSTILQAPKGSTESLRLRTKSKTGVYTITARVRVAMAGAATNNDHCGLCWRESSSGKVVVVGLTPQRILGVYKYTNATTFSASYVNYSIGPYFDSFLIRLLDDGSNRIVQVSMVTDVWLAVHSVSRTDFLTADQVGYYANSRNNADLVSVELLSWLEA